MLTGTINDLHTDLQQIELISTDVFDTLLLRKSISERSRIEAAEARFADMLRAHGCVVGVDLLVKARIKAQSIGYRALDLSCEAAELRLVDIISRQLRILGLPQTFVEPRIDIELDIEKTALIANRALAELLRRHREAGKRIIAISDTALSAARLTELIGYFHETNLLHQVYSSADANKSKRHGGLFEDVLRRENVRPEHMLHIGDDLLADKRMPKSLAINTIHLPRSRLRRYLSRADGAAAVSRGWIRGRLTGHASVGPATADRVAFGHDVFGPIVAEFCLLIWLYADQARQEPGTTLLFCARGGVGIREAFERLLTRLGLPLDMARGNLLISRLIACRSAVLTRSRAAMEEISREFRGESFATVARALGGRDYELPVAWQEPFEAAQFFSFLDSVAGQALLTDIRAQNDLFVRHLDQIAPGAKRIILCDTGLYGSTQRLLAAGFPDRHFETIQFARCNYKGLSEDHFPRVTGLVVQQNVYNPVKIESVVLRYWQLIEHLFEPDVPSVRRLEERSDGEVVANSGDLRYGYLAPETGNEFLTGALTYIDGVKSGGAALLDAARAWAKLKQAITNPSQQELDMLGIGARSVDFGRSDLVHVLHKMDRGPIVQRLKSVRSQLWREGAIAQEFPRLKLPLLKAVELMHTLRSLTTEWPI